jgi:CBS domain-containing protein
MKNEKVADWMTPNPQTIIPKATLPEAHRLMKDKNVRRLPVVNSSGTLVGIVSLTDVLEAEPSDATTLSIYELNYLLAKLTVEKIMSEDVVTVTPQDSVATAAKYMLEKKIGGIPVTEGNKLVGIITESDIFRMVVATYVE